MRRDGMGSLEEHFWLIFVMVASTNGLKSKDQQLVVSEQLSFSKFLKARRIFDNKKIRESEMYPCCSLNFIRTSCPLIAFCQCLVASGFLLAHRQKSLLNLMQWEIGWRDLVRLPHP
jgi:hypothetical protein